MKTLGVLAGARPRVGREDVRRHGKRCIAEVLAP